MVISVGIGRGGSCDEGPGCGGCGSSLLVGGGARNMNGESIELRSSSSMSRISCCDKSKTAKKKITLQ